MIHPSGRHNIVGVESRTVLLCLIFLAVDGAEIFLLEQQDECPQEDLAVLRGASLQVQGLAVGADDGQAVVLHALSGQQEELGAGTAEQGTALAQEDV